MRSTLTATAVVALLATTASAAAARPDAPLRDRHSSAGHAATVLSRGVQHHYGIDARPSSPGDAPVATVHVDPARVADGGVNWADIGIGAGLATALLLSAAGVSALRGRPSMPTR